MPLDNWQTDQIMKDPKFLDRHLITADPALWKMDRFRDFIEARKKLILERFKPYLQTARDAGEPA